MMKKEMKRITALLLAIVMVMGVVVNSDVLRSRAAAEASTTVDVALAVDTANGGNASGIYVKTSPADSFFTDDTWGDNCKPKAVTGGVYMDGKLIEGCPIIKCSPFYYIAFGDVQVTAVEGTKVVLDGIYGRSSSDPNSGDGYTVKFNKTTFIFTNNAWKQIIEEETDPDVTADIALDVTLNAGDKSMIWVKGNQADQLPDPGTSTGWGTYAVRVTGGIYVDGTLDTSRYFMKMDGRYAIGLDGTNPVNVVPGTTVVLDGIYSNEAGTYKVQFHKAVFEYTKDGWRQVEETERVPDQTVTPYLASGDQNMISLWTDKPDNLPSEGGWVLQNRVNGGIYVNGVLIQHCPFVKSNETTYLIPLADAGISITEGSTVVLDGIYGPSEWNVKFNKAVFQFINGKFQQIFTADAIVDPEGSDPTKGIYFYTNVPDGLAIGEGDGIWAIHHERYSGGIYVNGELSEKSTFLVKVDSQMNYASYYIDLMGSEVKDETKVVIDGVFGETQQLKVNKATFVYDASAGKWKQPVNGDSGATHIFGDANGNKEFDVTDFVHMLRYVASDTDEINLTDADVNNDHVIDDLDIQITRKILAGNTVTNENGNIVGKPIYNGTKRLSIGAYCGPRRGTKEYPTDWRTDAEFKRYADAGFNTLIAEYDVAYGKNFAADGTESAVKNFAGSDLDKYMGLANKYGLDVIVESPILNQVLKGNAALENAGAEITTMLSALKGMKNFKGILMSDEPGSDQISNYREVSAFLGTKDVMQGKSMYVSLLPYNVHDRSVFESGYGFGHEAKYDSYLREFGSCLGVVNPDIYPFGATSMLESYFKNLEMAATAAKGKADSGLTIQAFAAGSEDGNETWVRELDKKEYYTYQLYSAMAYGMKNISYYTYWEHFGARQEDSRQYYSMVNADGTVNEKVYNDVKEVNKEIRGFDQVYMDFNWQGTMKSESSTNNGLLAAMSDYKSARVNRFTATADTIMGCLKDSKGYDGFMLVNATDPKDNTSSAVTVQFKNAQKAITYRKGIESVVELSGDGTYTTTLPSGEGEFIIPYQENAEETPVAAEANIDVNFIEGDKTGINFWTDASADPLSAGNNDWSVRPVRVQGGIYLNGALKDIVFVKLTDVYRIALDDETITEGTTIVLDGVYCNADGTHPTRFNKAAFEFVNGEFRQIANIVPAVAVDASLNGGDKNGIYIGTTPGDNLPSSDAWDARPARVTGGIYVNGELKTITTTGMGELVKIPGQYYIAVGDLKDVEVSEGTVVVFNGIYGNAEYAVQFNRAVFVYRDGRWVPCLN